MGTQYERELKRILEGDLKGIDNVLRSCDIVVRDKMRKIAEQPFIVLRAAGSLGVDLVAIRGDISFPIEVKSSIHRVLYFGSRGHLAEQAEQFIRSCERAHVIPLYAFRLKNSTGDSWRIFTIRMDPMKGRQGVIQSMLPTIRESSRGNYVMDWDRGLPLHKFIDYLTQ